MYSHPPTSASLSMRYATFILKGLRIHAVMRVEFRIRRRRSPILAVCPLQHLAPALWRRKHQSIKRHSFRSFEPDGTESLMVIAVSSAQTDIRIRLTHSAQRGNGIELAHDLLHGTVKRLQQELQHAFEHFVFTAGSSEKKRGEVDVVIRQYGLPQTTKPRVWPNIKRENVNAEMVTRSILRGLAVGNLRRLQA